MIFNQEVFMGSSFSISRSNRIVGHPKALLAAAAAVASLCSFAGPASAAFTFTENTVAVPSSVVIAPDSVLVPSYFFSPTTGTVDDVRHSPFGDNTTPYSDLMVNLHNVRIPVNSATYNSHIGPVSSASLFWGSPDFYNNISFWSGLNGTGTELFCLTGGGNTAGCTGAPLQVGELLLSMAGNGKQLHDLVSILDLGGTFQSVVLTTTTNAFEYTSIGGLNRTVSNTPLPAALPLYAAGMGVMSFFGWRRKRSKSSAVST
jgi:hypothetical protein